jgi:hypothetical protein
LRQVAAHPEVSCDPEVEWALIGVTIGTAFITGAVALWDWLFG